MLNLEELRNYLKIDYDYEDEFLKELLNISEAYIQSCCGDSYRNNERLLKLAQLAQRKLITDMYSNRNTTIDNKSKRDVMITTIFDLLANAGD
ncbi:head-tail connector protein [Clostridium novyi]